MARIELCGVWLTRVDSPAAGLMLPAWFDWAWSESVPVVRQRTAAGRDRSFVSPGRSRSVTLSADYCPVDVAAALADLVGVVLCVRTPDGEKMFGRFDGLGRSWQKVRDGYYSVSITIVGDSHSEVI